jgi:hypothetical protein
MRSFRSGLSRIKTMDTSETPRSFPPYVSSQTFFTFLEKLKNGVPTRIDRSVFNGYSGAAISQVLGALKFLGFVTENGTSQERLSQFVYAKDESEASSILSRTLEESYWFLDGFDLSGATQKMLDDQFKEAGATGETVRKCVSFYLSLAQRAGMEISPHLRFARTGPSAPRRKGPRSKPKKARKPNPDEAGAPTHTPPPYIPPVSNRHPAIEGYLQELPDKGPWANDQAKSWLAGFKLTLAMVYKVDFSDTISIPAEQPGNMQEAKEETKG